MTKNIFTNAYGLARSILAFGTLLTLLLTSPQGYFNEGAFKGASPSSLIVANFFYLFDWADISFSIGIAAFILIWVISGYLPQLSGVLHAWISYSFFTGSIIVEGGDQMTQIITILLIPVTIFDKRLNHWSKYEFLKYNRPKFIEYFCFSFLFIIQVQMSIMYLFAAVDKLHVREWVDGSAVYYWFNNRPFGASEMLHFVFDPIVTNHYLSPLITWGVIILELLLFVAIFMKKTYKSTLFYFGVIFHFMILVVLGLSTFFISMLGGLILYLLPVEQNIEITLFKMKLPCFFNRVFIRMQNE